jgi:hypothetical protein
MYHELTLITPGHSGEQYNFGWDDETGELSGQDADWAKTMVASAIEDRRIACQGGTIPVTDPLHNKTQFAGIFGRDSAPDEITRWRPNEHTPGFVPYEKVPGAITLEELEEQGVLKLY